MCSEHSVLAPLHMCFHVCEIISVMVFKGRGGKNTQLQLKLKNRYFLKEFLYVIDGKILQN